MADEKTFSVGVQTSSPKRISVTSNVSENPITATPDTGLYYSQLAKNWATGEGLIENTDYSSKAYAQESKAYALDSKVYSESASLDLENLNNKIIEYDEQLNDTVATGLSEISVLQANSLAEITTNKESALSDIDTAETNVLANIDTTKLNTLAQIEELANSSIENINAIGIDTKVSKSGDTMTGDLMINNSNTSRIIVKGNKAVGTIPSSTYNYGYFGAFDLNNTHLGGVAVMQNTSGTVTAYLRATADNSNIKQITVSSNGATYCPASSATNSIVTTTGIKKASNGYVKLGNGIIIQWLKITCTGDTTVTVTFPITFSSASSYSATIGEYLAGTSDANPSYFTSSTARTASTIYLRNSSTASRDVFVIAIGY